MSQFSVKGANVEVKFKFKTTKKASCKDSEQNFRLEEIWLNVKI